MTSGSKHTHRVDKTHSTRISIHIRFGVNCLWLNSLQTNCKNESNCLPKEVITHITFTFHTYRLTQKKIYGKCNYHDHANRLKYFDVFFYNLIMKNKN